MDFEEIARPRWRYDAFHHDVLVEIVEDALREYVGKPITADELRAVIQRRLHQALTGRKE